ncbi:hypothetical protein MRX96_019057 [Rhipicephalus microplus]
MELPRNGAAAQPEPSSRQGAGSSAITFGLLHQQQFGAVVKGRTFVCIPLLSPRGKLLSPRVCGIEPGDALPEYTYRGGSALVGERAVRGSDMKDRLWWDVRSTLCRGVDTSA